ncbi:MAG TPA: porin [Ferruginibacter sp.]|jgi:phosphate-selective porin OprO/OprP|nr:porin [Ferruginibacter sp.]
MRFIKILSISLIALLFTVRATAQTTDDVLNILIQKGTITQQEADSIRAASAIAKQDEKAKQKIFPLNASRAFQVGGYTQVRYQSYPKANKADGVDIRRARLDIQGDITSRWNYRLLVDFVGGTSSVPAGTTTTTTNSVISPTLLDAYISYKFANYLKVTAGQFTLPFSAENNVQDRNLETVDRSQVVNALVARKGDGSNGIIDSIGNQNGRDIGVQISGSFFKINENRSLIDYYAGLFNGAGINVADNNESKDFSGRLLIHPFDFLTIGGSYYDGYDRFAKTPTKDQLRTRWGTELSFNYKALSIRSEFLRGQDGNDQHNITQPIPAIHQGWYAQAAYFIIPKRFQFVFKYDTYSPVVNPQSAGLNKVSDANTYLIFGANIFFNNWAKLQLDYSWRTEQGDIPAVQYNDVATAQLQLAF